MMQGVSQVDLTIQKPGLSSLGQFTLTETRLELWLIPQMSDQGQFSAPTTPQTRLGPSSSQHCGA